MKIVFSLSFGLFVCSLYGQKQIEDQIHGWAVYQGNHKLNNKLDLHTEYQWRRADGFAAWQQSLARIGLDYRLNPNCTFSGGYGWIISYPYGAQPLVSKTHEQRLWQQVNLKARYGSIQIQHRYRLEQRWIDTLFRQRIRYRAQCIIPLQQSYLNQGKGLFMNVNDEVFLGFGKGIGKNILDQNRFIAAVGYQFSPNLNVQMGYMNQFVIKANGVQMERNHTIWTSIVYNLDFAK